MSNKRTDEYGGSVENRIRFGLEVTDAVVAAVGASKVGIRVSPYTRFQGMETDNDEIVETYTAYGRELAKRNLAYTHFVESRIAGNTTVNVPKDETPNFWYDLVKDSGSAFLLCGGFDKEDAEPITSKYKNSVIVYGRHFLANPDLVERIRNDWPFQDGDKDSWYLKGPEETRGYIDCECFPFINLT